MAEPDPAPRSSVASSGAPADPSPGSGRRRALVTGASSGIGAAYARRLAADDWDLVLVARRVEALERLAGELGERRHVKAEVLPADLTVAADLTRVEEVLREPALELLVNNAGFGSVGAFHEGDVERDVRMLRLNVEAVVRLSHAALGAMVRRGRGAVVNVSSGAGLIPMPFYAVYAGTKAFVTSFTECLAEELAGTGVRVQALCPGLTRTEFQEVAHADTSRLPAFLWQDADEVVEASLEGLRRGSLIVVPGGKNRALLALRGPLARSATRRAMGYLGRRGWI